MVSTPISHLIPASPRYDLHCHSTASDGMLSPTEVVLRAAEYGVTTLALTDHDTVTGLGEAQIAAKQVNLKLINGVEISTQWENHSIHIVGLNFDPTHSAMVELLQQQQDLRQQRAKEIGERLAKIGVENAFFEASALTQGEVTRAHYARYLVQIGKAANQQQAFKKFLRQGKVAYVKTDWCDIPTAIQTIHASGGIAVVAHPLRYQMTTRKIKKLLFEFKQWGGDAIEVAGCGQTQEQRQLLIRWAKENGLMGSVGSDFHFPCQWIELGKSLYLNENDPELPVVWQLF
ncbi:phosphatase [Mergibacter septicus]|uniref:Phosphatase n=1 Tax=Mergibacter septicus TaxID=221402 RepID=A0A8D4LM28_9PAST|nr:PHP domain-containing protein [Mergibacter septicus]AWX15277.1 phosphatase [Mergibacter septicus]QDJ14531.1 phosphatase [Mergibacter septicus]UTU48032.1 PHP domain-containing protein [Mergibacter septicus]WMR96359.1 PHP domain-containing protein [Mergibacter septicus]